MGWDIRENGQGSIWGSRATLRPPALSAFPYLCLHCLCVPVLHTRREKKKVESMVVLNKVLSGFPVPGASKTSGNGDRTVSLADLGVGDCVPFAYSRRGSISAMISYHKAVRGRDHKFTRRVLVDKDTGEKYVMVWRLA